MKCDFCDKEVKNYIVCETLNERMCFHCSKEEPDTIKDNQIDLMIKYAQMMLDRKDWHGLWDAAIDLQRLTDRLKNEL